MNVSADLSSYGAPRRVAIRRSLAAAAVLLISMLCLVDTGTAQPPGQRTMGRNGWRWHATGNTGIVRRYWGGWGGVPYVQYGAYGAYSTPGYGVQTAYGDAVRANAQAAVAQSQINKANAQAAEYNEKAREQYLKNQAVYNEMRQQQRAAMEERKAAKEAETQARRDKAASRPKRRPTDLYPRLGPEQLEPAIGGIIWPESLQGESFAEDREKIEKELTFIAESGPNARSASVIREVCERMKDNTASIMTDMGFDTYREARKFLCSLSVEGYYALEEL